MHNRVHVERSYAGYYILAGIMILLGIVALFADSAAGSSMISSGIIIIVLIRFYDTLKKTEEYTKETMLYLEDISLQLQNKNVQTVKKPATAAKPAQATPAPQPAKPVVKVVNEREGNTDNAD